MIRKFVLGAAITLLGLAGTAGAAAASPAHPASALALRASCHTTEVTLHPDGAPTSRCLSRDGGAIRTGHITPDIGTDPSCGSVNDLVLYWNGPIDVAHGVIPPGPILCIRGQGDLDLASQTYGGLNWNDEASAWWAGCSSGTFHQNDPVLGIFSGTNENFSGGSGTSAPSGNFDGRPGVLPNDSLTDVYQSTNC